MKTAAECDVVLAIFDGSAEPDDLDREVLMLAVTRPCVFVLNKQDLPADNLKKWEDFFGKNTFIAASAKSGHNISEIKKSLYEKAFDGVKRSDSIVITNARHARELSSAFSALQNAQLDVPLDCVAAELRRAITAVGNVTGTNVSEAVLDEIFSRFCLGK